MSETTAFTVREAAFVFGAEVKEITRLLDEHAALILSSALSGRHRGRKLGMPDLMYFQALNEFGELFTPKGRWELHAALLTSHKVPSVSINKLQLPIEELQASVEKRLEILQRIRDQVEGNPADPLIKGTSVEVYRVAALFEGGANIEQIQEDYPELSEAQIRMTSEYAKVIPKKGRPYPKKSFKRALEALNFDALDDIEE